MLGTCLVGLLLGTTRSLADSDDVEQLKVALLQSILAPGQSAQELRTFIEPKIVTLPQFADLATWEQAAAQLRRDMLDRIVFRGTASAWREAKCQVVWLDTIAGGPGYRIRKFRYE